VCLVGEERSDIRSSLVHAGIVTEAVPMTSEETLSVALVSHLLGTQPAVEYSITHPSSKLYSAASTTVTDHNFGVRTAATAVSYYAPPMLGVIGPILWGHSGPLCHVLSLLSLSLWTLILHCHSPGVATVALRLRYSYSWLRLILVVVSTVATPGEWQCKIRTGGVHRLAVANGPNIFQMLLVNQCCDLSQVQQWCILGWLLLLQNTNRKPDGGS